jgi:hypothetical protein
MSDETKSQLLVNEDQNTVGHSFTVDYKLFEKILNNNDFTKLNAFEVCRKVYEITYVYFRMQMAELKAERDKQNNTISTIYADFLKLQEKYNALAKRNEECRLEIESLKQEK